MSGSAFASDDHQVCQPDIDRITDGLAFTWPSGDESRVVIGLSRMVEDTRTGAILAEVEIGLNINGSGPTRLLANSRVNLVSPKSRNELVRLIKERAFTDDIQYYPWVTLIEQVAGIAIAYSRQTRPIVKLGDKPESTEREYSLYPILAKNEITTIYGAGGAGKSYLADFIAVLVQYGFAGFADWSVLGGPQNVLYLDWESSESDHRRRIWAVKQGLGIENSNDIAYLFCDQPLVGMLPSIKPIIVAENIGLVIADSQMPAAGTGTDSIQVATGYFNAARALGVTFLSLDHINKEDMRAGDSPAPTGPLVKYNRSRSVFELQKAQEPGKSYLDLVLIHRKCNEGQLLRKIGFRIQFTNGPGGSLESVTFSESGIDDNPALLRAATKTERITAALKDQGTMTIAELAEYLDDKAESLKALLYKNKRIFVQVDKINHRWGLKTFDQ